jgi:hypothetical protein
MWATIGGSQAVIQDGQYVTSNEIAAVAQKWTQVVASVTDPNTGQVNSASIVQELDAYANSADGTLNSIYTVRTELAGGAGAITYTVTAATPTATVNNKGNNVLTRTAITPAGSVPVIGMNVYGPGIQGGTVISAVNGNNVTLSKPLNRDASTASNGYTFSNQKLVAGGFGLAASTGAGSGQAPTIDFGISANRFWIAAPAGSYDPAAEFNISNAFPFIVLTTPTVINGVELPPGAYMKKAFIADASIDTAKIYYNIHSNNFNGTFDESGAIVDLGSIGWAIDKSGRAVLNNVHVRGTLEAGMVKTASMEAGASTGMQSVKGINGATSISLQVTIPDGSSGLLILANPGLMWEMNVAGSAAPSFVTVFIDATMVEETPYVPSGGAGAGAAAGQQIIIRSDIPPGEHTITLARYMTSPYTAFYSDCRLAAMVFKR